MDAGSFVFELNGVRWAIDPGNQAYDDLERTGFDLWSNCQDCPRWTLLTKNNFGHNTLTVNDRLHVADATAPIVEFKDGKTPEATVDMSRLFKDMVKSAYRKFIRDSSTSIVVEDTVEKSGNTRMVTWQLLTQADVEITPDGAILRQEGKVLKLENLTHPNIAVSVVSLYPAPLELDRQIEGLKRIEIRIPAWTIKNDKETIRVRLS